ncbi:hypothetical protein C0585_01905 [Candidatus Woesearchaeota archaeon]|nr:MAG: hypothetical protein C0585_01905 [Candidatus Woesearchaeota archaeon]
MEIGIIGRRNLANLLYSRVVNSFHNTKKRVTGFLSSYKTSPQPIDHKEIYSSLYPGFEKLSDKPIDSLELDLENVQDYHQEDNYAVLDQNNSQVLESIESVFQDVPKRSEVLIDEDKEFEKTLDEMFAKCGVYEEKRTFEYKTEDSYLPKKDKLPVLDVPKTYSGKIDYAKENVDKTIDPILTGQISDLLDVAKGQKNWFWGDWNKDGSKSRLEQLNLDFKRIYDDHGDDAIDSLLKVYKLISENKTFQKKLEEKNLDALRLRRFVKHGVYF